MGRTSLERGSVEIAGRIHDEAVAESRKTRWIQDHAFHAFGSDLVNWVPSFRRDSVQIPGIVPDERSIGILAVRAVCLHAETIENRFLTGRTDFEDGAVAESAVVGGPIEIAADILSELDRGLRTVPVGSEVVQDSFVAARIDFEDGSASGLKRTAHIPSGVGDAVEFSVSGKNRPSGRLVSVGAVRQQTKVVKS